MTRRLRQPAGFVAHLRDGAGRGGPHRGPTPSSCSRSTRPRAWSGRSVFLTGLERGLVPIAYAETPAALAEERRLLYVALTRAERELHLSWAQRRTLGGPGDDPPGQPVPGVDRGRPGRLRARRRRRLAGGRGRRTGPAGHGPGRGRSRPGDGRRLGRPRVLAELVAWRKTLARASGVPAQVIFHDATLAAVAEARPTDRDALMAVPGLGPAQGRALRRRAPGPGGPFLGLITSEGAPSSTPGLEVLGVVGPALGDVVLGRLADVLLVERGLAPRAPRRPRSP